MVTIKDKYLKILSCLVILVLGLSIVPVASASPPSLPNVFQGKLITDGEVAEGTIISAYIDSELAGFNTIDKAGEYELGVSGTEEDNGKEIVFKLSSVESEPVSATYQHGATPVELDLTFKGEFLPPFIRSFSTSPVYILNDGEDYSVIRATVSDELSGIMAVTIDLTPMGGEVVSLTPKSEGIYTCYVSSNLAGEFELTFTATDNFGNKVDESILITVVSEDELMTKYGGADNSFSAEEIKNVVNNDEVSSRIKYTILGMYFDDGWDQT